MYIIDSIYNMHGKLIFNPKKCPATLPVFGCRLMLRLAQHNAADV